MKAFCDWLVESTNLQLGGSGMKTLVAFVLLFVAWLVPSEATAQANFGGHVSIAEDTDFGIGPRVMFTLSQNQNIAILGTFDWFFVDEDELGDINYLEVAGSVLYRFQGSQFKPHAGGGLVLGRASNGDSESEIGVLLLGGTTIGRQDAQVLPFVDFRIALSGPEQFVLSGGVYF